MSQLIFLLSLIGASNQLQGKLKLAYEPKHCITDPCPQFKVLEINSKKQDKIWGADLENFNLDQVYPLQELLVEGTWTQIDDSIRVKVKKWKVINKK